MVKVETQEVKGLKEIRTKMQQEDVTRMLEEMDMKAGGLVDLPIIQRKNLIKF